MTDDNGERKRIERPARLKPWWTKTAAGNIVLFVKYGAKPIEIQKGKPAIEVGATEKLPSLLKTLKDAVVAGELDAEIGLAVKDRSLKRK